MDSYLMLCLSAVLLAIDFVINKFYQRKAGTSLQAGLIFNVVLGLFTTFIFWALSGFQFTLSGFSCIMAAVMSLLCVSYNILGFRILKNGSVAVYTLFLMTGGMVLPYVWGLLFLNEQLSLSTLIGLILLIGSVVICNLNTDKSNAKQLLLCIIVFVLNGLVSIVSKMHQVEASYITVSANQFVMLTGIFKAVISLVASIFIKEKASLKQVCNKNTIVLIVGSAFVGGLSYMLQLIGAKDLPATILYPFITGGSMVFSSLAGVLVFKEKLSVKLIISLIISCLATLLFL